MATEQKLQIIKESLRQISRSARSCRPAADQALDVGLQEKLKNALGDGHEEVAFSALLQQFALAAGRRGVLGWD